MITRGWTRTGTTLTRSSSRGSSASWRTRTPRWLQARRKSSSWDHLRFINFFTKFLWKLFYFFVKRLSERSSKYMKLLICRYMCLDYVCTMYYKRSYINVYFYKNCCFSWLIYSQFCWTVFVKINIYVWSFVVHSAYII